MVSLDEALKYNKKQMASYLDRPYETVKRWDRAKLTEAIIERHKALNIVNTTGESQIVETLKAKRKRREEELEVAMLDRIEELLPRFGLADDGLTMGEAKILTAFLDKRAKIELEAVKAGLKK